MDDQKCKIFRRFFESEMELNIETLDETSSLTFLGAQKKSLDIKFIRNNTKTNRILVNGVKEINYVDMQ